MYTNGKHMQHLQERRQLVPDRTQRVTLSRANEAPDGRVLDKGGYPFTWERSSGCSGGLDLSCTTTMGFMVSFVLFFLCFYSYDTGCIPTRYPWHKAGGLRMGHTRWRHGITRYHTDSSIVGSQSCNCIRTIQDTWVWGKSVGHRHIRMLSAMA